MFLLCLCCCADSPLLPYTRGLAMPESGAVVEFPIGPSATPSLATRTAPTFLTSSSINNARASRLSNPFNANFALFLSQPSSDATFSSLRSLFSTFFFQHARWKRKVDRWKGWFQGVCGEDSKVPQRKGWPAGQYMLFSSCFPLSLSMAYYVLCVAGGVCVRLAVRPDVAWSWFFFHFLRRVKTLKLSILVIARFILAFSCHNAPPLFCPPMLSGHTTCQRLPPLCFSGHFKLTIIQCAVPLRSC